MKLFWRLLCIIISITTFIIILNWIGFDFGNFSDLWNGILQGFHDVARVTKGILK